MAKILADLINQVITPLYNRHPHMTLMMEWPLIVGADISSYTWPSKILRPGKGQPVLYLHVKDLREMEAWGSSGLIIERVNQHFGYAAIQKIRFLRQNPSRISGI